METKNRLMNEKANLLKQIAESAQRGNSQEVLDAGVRLGKIESLIERYDKLLEDISDLETRDRKMPNQVASRQASVDAMDMASGRGIGKGIRMGFLKKSSEKGIHLEHIKGSIYETRLGHKVGIAVATERNPDRWFLGLPLEGFDHAVLLCRHETGNTVEICLAKNFFDQFGNKMSQSGGQMKFNVARRGSGYVILVPGTDGVSATKFVGDYSFLH